MKRKNNIFHQPALLKETINFLNIKPGEVYIDATCGGAGHSEAILKKGGKVFALDWDIEAVNFSKKRLLSACPNASFKIIKANFANLKKILKQNNIAGPAGILFDLGTSFHQLTTKGRGFSFNLKEPLDMRMDLSLKINAYDLVNGLSRKELNELFYKLGEEKQALAVAKAIVLRRSRRPIKNTLELADIVRRVYRRKKIKTKIHPATKVFQALRVAVNDELNNLRTALNQAEEALKNKGRLVVISFQGLEDKIVKNFLKRQNQQGKMKIITKKPVRPSLEEIKNNPRCRSAKLRCGEKI